MAFKKEKEKKEEEAKGLEATLALMNKKYGKGTVINGKDVEEGLEVVPTGSLGLDKATYIGGLPIGKLIEIYGPESSGKSTITLHIISEFQKKGKKCVLIDSEQSFDRKYATALGIDVDAIVIVQPECAEDGYNIAQNIIKTGEVGLVVLDSQTALVPRGVLNGEVGDAKMALAARVNSEALQKIHPILKDNNCTLIAISQLRTAIGDYGDPNKPTGGLAYKFYSDMRLKVSKQISKETESNKTTVTVIKSKCGAPYGEAIFSINWGTGIDRLLEVIDFAIEKKIIEVGGSWYTINGNKVQGEEKVKDYLINNPEYLKELEKQIL